MSQLADKILHDMVKDFVKTGNEFSSADFFIKQYPNEDKHIVYGAIRLLDNDGFVAVSYGDNEPDEIILNMNAIRKCDEDTFIKKGYILLKEIRSWL
ncbi:MAG: hypothetical protein ACYCWE_21075 [Eubacteriales bacterium]